MKKATVVGVQEVVSICFYCPHCDIEFSMPPDDFSETFGDPYYNEQEDTIFHCEGCDKDFELGEFEVEP